MKRFILLILALLPFSAFAQVKVSGAVTDSATNESMIGAGVLVKGTTNGVVTDIDGHYEITVPSGDVVLEFTCIGYSAKSIPVSGRSVINVAMDVDATVLDDVVVVGYSVQKKRDVLGAVSKVTGTELTKVPVASVSQSLQGRIAGVEVTSQTGAPGSSISVRVRGSSSISSSNDPLYIVDGIPVESGLNNISPNDIENITVLKDASSAAIYGSRASNGVVLVTTKSGQKGSARISYNMQSGVQFHGHLTPMTNTAEYIQMYNEAATADNASSVVKRPLIEGEYLKDFADVNHVKEIFQVAPINSHELSVSGGNDKTQYLVSGSYYGQKGIIRTTNYQRGSLRSNITSQVKDWLKVGLNINGSLSSQRMVSSSGDGYGSGEGGSVVRYAFFRNPAIPVYDSEGNYVDLPSEYYGNSSYNTFFGDGYSPEGLIDNTDRTSKTKSLLATGNILINFTKNIFLNTTAGVDYRDYTLRVFNPTWGSNNRINSSNNLDVSKVNDLNWTVNSTFNHRMNFGAHSVNYLVGTELIKNHEESVGLSDTQFADTSKNLVYVGLGNGINRATQGESGSALMSFFASANYNYQSKYYVSAIIREDGSSRFSKKNRWGTFYSVSAGWNMEEEDFLKGLEAVNKLKIRAGYGAIGNQNIGLYAYNDRYTPNYYYAIGTGVVNGYAQTALANENLKWETSSQVNVGVDYEGFNNTFGVSVDYYYKVTKDMLVQESVPLSVGNLSAPWVNNGSVLNTGVDIEMFYRRNFKDWGFDVTLNGGYLHNEVLSLNSPIQSGRVDSGVYATLTQVGHPIGSFYLYQMEGIFQSNTEIMLHANQGASGTIVPGDVKYKDINNDGVIDEKDRTFCGSAIPKFTAGLNLALNYKNWDFSMFFQGAFGQKIFSQINYDIEGYYRGFNLTKRYYKEHWTETNHSNTQPRASWSGKTNNVKASTRFLEDGSYVRLKNIQLGYNFKMKENCPVSSCRLYVAGSNLLTFTKYSGLDPEMTVSTNSSSEGDRANGIDWGTYPVARSVTLGLNITF